VIPYSAYYDYDRLERAAEILHPEMTEETEICVLNLHNHLIWHSYQPGMYPEADAIFSLALKEIMREHNLDASDILADFRELASSVVERR
jgi:hypothetical protein